MSAPYKEFNKYAKDFLRELDRVYVNEWCFKFMLQCYKLIKSMKKSLPHKYFQQMVNIPHGPHLRNRDDSSIFDEAYKPPALYANLVQRLKELWRNLDETTKATIWNHLHVLLVLNDKCIEYRTSKNMPPIETLDDSSVDD